MLISFTATDRLGYLRRVLASWQRSAKYSAVPLKVLAIVEPSDPGVAQAFRDIDWADQVEVRVNEQKVGLPENPRRALEWGFELDDWVVLAEDDTVVSPDAVDYLAWCRDQFRDDPRVLTVTACQLQFADAQPSEARLVMRETKLFRPSLWGTWKDRWESWINPNWAKYNPKGWDWSIGDYINHNEAVVSAAPIWSRSCHIGRNGAHMQDQYWFGNQPGSFLTEYVGPPYRDVVMPRDPGPTGVLTKDIWR